MSEGLCETCWFSWAHFPRHPDYSAGHCYMFREKPERSCAQWRLGRREEEPSHDFSGLSDMDLVRMQHQLRAVPEDKDFLHAVLVELGNRQKTHDLNDEEKAKRKNTT